MPFLVECPICEHRFSVSRDNNNKELKCSGCDRVISRDRFVAVDDVAYPIASENKPSLTAIAPRRLTTEDTPAEVAVSPPPIRSTEAAEDMVPWSETFSVKPPAINKQRKLNPLTRNIVVLVLAIGSVAALFAIVMVLNQAGTDRENTTAKNDQPAADSSGTDTKSRSPLDDVTGVGGNATAQPLEPVDESPNYFSQSQWKTVWQQVNPYLVRLKIESPIEERVVTGLLVDSRGWVSTSYRALRDAGRVRVTIAGNELAGDSQFRSVTDDARGIIATDPDRDLALIAINRSQVLNLADVPILTHDNIVSSQRCFIGRVPPARHRKWLAECRVAGRATFERLSADEKNTVNKVELTKDPMLEWIIHPANNPGKKTDEIMGSPIFNESGQVIAFNTAVSADGNLMALPAMHIKELVDSVASDEPKPFTNASQLQGWTADETPQQAEVKALRQESSQMVKRLRTAYEICRDTGWTADSAAEYVAFQSLAETWIRLHIMAQSNAHQSEFAGPLEAELQTFMELISVSLVDDVDDDEIAKGKGNQWFNGSVSRQSPWFVIVADVSRGVGSSPQIGSQPTISVKLVGSDQVLLSPYLEDYKNLKPGRRYMMFGQLDPRAGVRGNLLDDQRMRLINISVFVEMPK